MNLFRSISLLILIIPAILNAQSDHASARSYYQDDELVPRERSVDFQELKLMVSFDPEQKLVKGDVRQSFKVLRKELDSIRLDGINMNYLKVELDGVSIDYKEDPKGISLYFKKLLTWDSEHVLHIQYEANPKRGLYFIGWDDMTGTSRKQIWTQGQGIDNRHWIPMYDDKNDKVISELIVNFEDEYQVLSNGKLLKEKELKEGMKQWHYKITKPHASYLIMLGIGLYEIDERKSASGVPMKLYYYPDQPEQLEATYKYSVEMFDFFEKEIGVPYPWKSYAQIPVQNFMYGAMENTTATIFGDFYLVDERGYLDRNYIRVNAHELAHQWFGDMVTARSSAHHWLQESFATHYDMTYQGEAFGPDHFDWVRKTSNESALTASAEDVKPIAHSSAGTTRHYPKGAFVLQMLKYVVGREQYNAAIQYYLEKHAYGNVDSEDLLVAFHEKLGYSLDWFWEEWIYKGGEPHYQVNFQNYGKKGVFNVKQVHEINNLVGLFKMPIDFQVVYKDGSSDRKTVWIEEQSHVVSFDLKGEVDYYLFDPNYQVMKEVSFNKPLEVLKAQAQKAEHMLDRYEAIQMLVNSEFDGKDDFLIERFKAEEFHAIKDEIVNYLVPKLDDKSAIMVAIAANDEDADVRKALLKATYRIPANLEPVYRMLLNDQSYVNVELALDLLCFYFPMNREDYLNLTAMETGSRSNNIRTSWLKWAYLEEGNEQYLAELKRMSSNQYEFLTRINAAESLKDLNYLDEAHLASLLEATFSFNGRLARPITEILEFYFEQESYKALMISYISTQNWDDREFKKVKRFLLPN